MKEKVVPSYRTPSPREVNQQPLRQLARLSCSDRWAMEANVMKKISLDHTSLTGQVPTPRVFVAALPPRLSVGARR